MMGKLEKIIGAGILALALGCSKSQQSDVREQPNIRTVTFSNGMSAYGKVEILKSNRREITIVHSDYDMEIHDEGAGNVYVIYQGRKLPNLTYSYGSRKFPVWEPYAFRESKEYRETARELSEVSKIKEPTGQ